MNRLSLPGFNPTQPLSFHLWVRTLIHPYYGVTPGQRVEMYANMFVDNFVGISSVLGVFDVPDLGLPFGAPYQYEMDIIAADPARHNLTGGEGWFYLSGPCGSIYDCVVTYTPATLQDASTAVGHFS